MRFLIALLLVIVSACVSSTQSTIVGRWRGREEDTQLGRSVEELCFRQDGRVEWNAVTQAGPLHNEGTYTLESGTLTLAFPDPGETTVLAAIVNRCILTISDTDGKRAKYSRISASCP